MKERIDYIDIARAIAIFLVVTGHIIFFSIFQENVECSKSNSLFYFLSCVEMPLFVFCSGLVAKCRFDNSVSIKREIKKKIRTLIVPFLVFGCLFAIYSERSLSQFALNTMKLGYWYLLTLFELHILNYVFIWISSKYEKFRYGWLLDCFLGLIIYASLFLLYRGTDPESASWKNALSILKLRQYYLMFFFMVFSRKYNLIEKVLFNPYISAIYISISFVVLFCNATGVHFIGRSIILPWTLSLTILFLCKCLTDSLLVNRGGYNSIIQLGRNSLDVYLIHFFFIEKMDLSFLSAVLSSHSDFLCSSMLVFPMTIVVLIFSLIVGKVIHSNKIINSTIFYR